MAKALDGAAVAKEGFARWQLCVEAEDAQRKAILAAKEFRAGNQWPEEVRLQRQGAPAIQGMAAQPARPCLTIDRVSQPVRMVSNLVRQANFEIDAIPVGSGADQETADIYKGWMRRIQNQARSVGPIEWAADQAAEGGIGWFKLCADYVDEDSFDQDISLEKITNNLSVYCDPNAWRPTRSDAKFLFQTEDLPKDEARRQYPDLDLAALNEFLAAGDTGGWVTDDQVRIAEYWRVEHTKVELVELQSGQTLRSDTDAEQIAALHPEAIKRTRVMHVPHVLWSKITATQELERTSWLGSRIPYIPVIGEELNVDGKAVLRGVIAPAMDPQRMVNYTYSAAIETAALNLPDPPVVAEGQIDDYKAIWQTRTTMRHSYLPYTPTALMGQPMPPPSRMQSAGADIESMVRLMMLSEEGVKVDYSRVNVVMNHYDEYALGEAVRL